MKISAIKKRSETHALTKDDIVHSIYTRLDLPKYKSTEVTEPLPEIIKRTLAKGNDVLISKFGRFSFKEKREWMGRNPPADEKTLLRDRRVVRFISSAILRNRIYEKI
ncbi:MAG: HU family DNA-binding protein [Deltaproteobacteria bacterium]|nr:HU family DNA-binding protein [Deltaproteobacteria bacterium]MBW2601022.1 HU family DNA-binding protein [Deltaproteobacteria bacterium]